MRAVRGRDTGPEKRVRALLTGMGRRYRLQRGDLPGTPDIVMTGARLALFVHGCFWHGHDCKRGDRQPKANADYWRKKIARNRARDACVRAALSDLGWRVEIVWECQLKDEDSLKRRLQDLLADQPAVRRSVGARSPSSPAPGSDAASIA